MKSESECPVIIFDGVCNFCNASINFVLRHERNHLIRFAPNQEASGRKILEKFHKPVLDVSTVFLYENGKLYDRSSAALRITRHLKFPWNLAYVLLITPAFLRDPIYNFIAKRRYKWFGKTEACRIPTPEERSRFL